MRESYSNVWLLKVYLLCNFFSGRVLFVSSFDTEGDRNSGRKLASFLKTLTKGYVRRNCLVFVSRLLSTVLQHNICGRYTSMKLLPFIFFVSLRHLPELEYVKKQILIKNKY